MTHGTHTTHTQAVWLILQFHANGLYALSSSTTLSLPQEDEGFYIRSGIVTVLRNAEIPDGTVV